MATEKHRFIYRENIADSTRGYLPISGIDGINEISDKTKVIDNESNLLKGKIKSREKVQLKLNDTFSPDNFNLPYSNNYNNNNNNTKFYYPTKSISAGKGFGNLDISNGIRVGGSSRIDSQQYKEYRESRMSFEHKFENVLRDPPKADNVVMSFPRGGENTRNRNQLKVDTMRNITSTHGLGLLNNNDNNDNNMNQTNTKYSSFDFKY